MEENIKDMSTQKLLTMITRLEQEIDLKTIKYNLLAKEFISRYPDRADTGEFTLLTKDHIKI